MEDFCALNLSGSFVCFVLDQLDSFERTYKQMTDRPTFHSYLYIQDVKTLKQRF